MRDFFKMLLIVAASLVMGAYLHKCQSPTADIPGRGCVVDATTYIDTIPYYEPVPTSTAPLGYKFITIPSFFQGKRQADGPTHSTMEADTLPRIRADTEVGEIIIEATDTDMDSMNLRLPIVQNVYEDTTYKAYVSGVCPRLDSIFVYPRREVVTIKKPPKRWHIGPTIGYGLTPHGFQPYAGISITFSVIQF